MDTSNNDFRCLRDRIANAFFAKSCYFVVDKLSNSLAIFFFFLPNNINLVDMESIFERDDDESLKDSPNSEKRKLFKRKKSPKSSDKRSLREKLESPEGIQLIYLVFGFIAIAFVMIMVQYSTEAICCGDQDGYYHIRWSSLLWANFSQLQWLPEFSWLPLTVLNPSDYADHHFMFHLLQIPFLWFFDEVTAAKIGAIVFGSLAIFSVYWLLWRYKMKYLLLWLLALLTCANPFFYRMNMAKAPPLTIIYTVIGIYLLFEEKYKWLLPLAFVFVWTYSLFPLLLVIALIWVGIIAVDEARFEWKPLAYTIGGMILGNIINPYFPNNIALFLEHFWTKAGSLEITVGGEWYPYSGVQLLTHLTVALLAMLFGYILYRPQNKYLPKKATFFLVFATLLLIWMFRSKRLAEYFPPIAIAFLAFSWQAFFKHPVIELPEEFIRDIDPYLDSEKQAKPKGFWSIINQAVPWVIGTVLVVVFYWNFIGVNFPRLGLYHVGLVQSVRKNEPLTKFKRSIEWARDNIPEGERIFNCNWDDFPKLFFFDQKHSYVYGLDPMYLYTENPELYGLVKDITGGKVEDPAPLIREKLGANYVFTPAKENVTFVAQILESGWADTVYQDKDAIILRIRSKRGTPPKELDFDAPQNDQEKKELKKEELKENRIETKDNEDNDEDDLLIDNSEEDSGE